MPKSAPLSPIVIGDFDTGIIDKQYEGQLISERIDECGKEARNHGKYVSRVARLTNELRRKGIITEERMLYRVRPHKRGYHKKVLKISALAYKEKESFLKAFYVHG